MYRMDTHGARELRLEDPFAGRGMFLPHTGTAQEIMAALEEAFGIVPAVTWEGHGAWLDLENADLAADAISASWPPG